VVKARCKEKRKKKTPEGRFHKGGIFSKGGPQREKWAMTKSSERKTLNGKGVRLGKKMGERKFARHPDKRGGGLLKLTGTKKICTEGGE